MGIHKFVDTLYVWNLFFIQLLLTELIPLRSIQPQKLETLKSIIIPTTLKFFYRIVDNFILNWKQLFGIQFLERNKLRRLKQINVNIFEISEPFFMLA